MFAPQVTLLKKGKLRKKYLPVGISGGSVQGNAGWSGGYTKLWPCCGGSITAAGVLSTAEPPGRGALRGGNAAGSHCPAAGTERGLRKRRQGWAVAAPQRAPARPPGVSRDPPAAERRAGRRSSSLAFRVVKCRWRRCRRKSGSGKASKRVLQMLPPGCVPQEGARPCAGRCGLKLALQGGWPAQVLSWALCT